MIFGRLYRPLVSWSDKTIRVRLNINLCHMEYLVKIIEILSPALQALAGGLIAILGSMAIQRRDHKKEKDEFYRSKIEQCHELSLRVEEAYSQEELTLALLVKTKKVSPYITRKLEEGEEGGVVSAKLLSIIELYLPKLSECAREYQLIEATLAKEKAKIYENYSTLLEDDYEVAVKKSFGLFWDKGIELRALLSEEAKKYAP